MQRILLYCHLFYSLIGYLDCVQTLPVDSSHDVIMSHDYYNNDFILLTLYLLSCVYMNRPNLVDGHACTKTFVTRSICVGIAQTKYVGRSRRAQLFIATIGEELRCRIPKISHSTFHPRQKSISFLSDWP